MSNSRQTQDAQSTLSKGALLLLSFLIVAFGQPAWTWWTGLLAACLGYACCWLVLIRIEKTSQRFWTGAAWYMAVQAVQLSWMVSHPYLYIYGVLLFCAGMMGLQFGVISLLIRPSLFTHFWRLCAVAALWTLLEWSRLFFLSGFSWNPSGLALTGTLYPLQMASLGGVYLLSFWVILTNLMAVQAWLSKWKKPFLFLWVALASVPYIFGVFHFHWHERQMAKNSKALSTLLFQTAFPIEENIKFTTAEEARLFVLGEWMKIFELARPQLGKPVDLLVLPEYVVPYGTYYPVFPLETAQAFIGAILGIEHLKALPPLEEPYVARVETAEGAKYLVTNAFFAQTLANLFQADVVIGLEDVEYTTPPAYESYSAAFHFPPNNGIANRYEKRVLVPMGEYIPLEWFRSLASRYGISGSFTPGKEAKVFKGKVPFTPSICYEETYGSLMCEGKAKGAELLVNLTSDVWYPDSRLPQQHFDHARLRSVESGIPLVRSCNTGVTGAVDSLGRIVKVLGEDCFKDQWRAEALLVEVPTYHYATFYSRWGDNLVVFLCLILIANEILRLWRNPTFK